MKFDNDAVKHNAPSMSVRGHGESLVAGVARGQDAHSRSLFKAISWRLTGTLDTFVIGFHCHWQGICCRFDRRYGIVQQDRAVLWPRKNVGISPLGTILTIASRGVLGAPLRHAAIASACS
jgi:hypothetical protein